MRPVVLPKGDIGFFCLPKCFRSPTRRLEADYSGLMPAVFPINRESPGSSRRALLASISSISAVERPSCLSSSTARPGDQYEKSLQ